VEPKLNRRRALFVLDKVDEILSWERQTLVSETGARPTPVRRVTFSDLTRLLRPDHPSMVLKEDENEHSGHHEYCSTKIPQP
jgi:hypothetical protein